MKNLPDLVNVAKEQLHRELPFIWTYEILLPGPEMLRITNYTEAINFGTNSNGEPVTYSPFPVSSGRITQSSAGDLAKLQVTIGNVTKEIGERVDAAGGLTGEPVTVRILNIETLEDPAAKMEWRSSVNNVELNQETVTFELSAVNIQRSRIPGWRYSALACRRNFGGVMCGYVILDNPTDIVGGGFSLCGKSQEACEERGDDEVARGLERKHPLRWGAWKGIPRR